MVLVNTKGSIELFNQRAQEMFGYQFEEVSGRPVEVLLPLASRAGHVATRQEFFHAPRARMMQGRSNTTLAGLRKDGAEFAAEVSLSPVQAASGPAVVAAIRDVSERRLLESQLQQAQKMETIGRLAGGIAHDFNNLLSVINATADLAMLELQAGDPTLADLETIRFAGDRAAALTQQLLTFSRKHVVQPATVDLNVIVTRTVPILRRLVSENISIVVCLAENLWGVLADPIQIEQVILNLGANAGDAMPAGGTLTIVTANVTPEDVDPVGAGVQPRMPQVSLTMRDTGGGMDERTQARIFEPFFTTKEVGRGTGLGLATVFGIVKQCGGDIQCFSEIGRGTSFRIVLPRDAGEVIPVDDVAGEVPKGAETVLVIEDDAALRHTAQRILEGYGYTVLAASCGGEAVRLVVNEDRNIDLVLSDVVMPGMSGPAVVRQIQEVRPLVKALFTSGYTDNALGQHGVLELDLQFIAKPYSAQSLARKVRAVLDR